MGGKKASTPQVKQSSDKQAVETKPFKLESAGRFTEREFWSDFTLEERRTYLKRIKQAQHDNQFSVGRYAGVRSIGRPPFYTSEEWRAEMQRYAAEQHESEEHLRELLAKSKHSDKK